MKISSLRDYTRDELEHRERDLKEEMFNLQMRRTMKPLDNPLRLRLIRRELARIATIVTEDRRGIRTITDTRVSVLGDSDKKEKKA
ncbi:MAG: 50S ribosomal protein L29 [candidate division Zixibacteria bacterium]|nr:50S ribosomal protein L29 [candidate division Zixibacteria bacterium]